jgi:enoyl-CoA hydratase
MQKVLIEKKGAICTIILNRPESKNAVNRETAIQLYEAFVEFDRDEAMGVGVLYGEGGCFCAGADLKKVSLGFDDKNQSNPMNLDMTKPASMGPSRLTLSKPMIAAISGYAVAGGLELACLCDLRVMEEDAIVGVFCRRFGVPLIDGGTKRLQRIIGMGRALDLILTGRPVGAQECLQIGLANRVVPKGKVREEAEALANHIAAFPKNCMLNDRKSLYAGYDLPLDVALSLEFQYGLQTIYGGETQEGGKQFLKGTGRHGEFNI